MNDLAKACEAAQGLAFLVKHAPEGTQLIEVAALIELVAQSLEQASDGSL